MNIYLTDVNTSSNNIFIKESYNLYYLTRTVIERKLDNNVLVSKEPLSGSDDKVMTKMIKILKNIGE